MARLNMEGSWKGIILIALLAVFGLYLFAKFTTTDATGSIIYNTAVNASQVALTLFKMLIVGIGVFFGYALAVKVGGGSLSRRDAFTLILIGIAVWFLWDSFLSGIFNAPNLEQISLSVMQKTGFLG